MHELHGIYMGTHLLFNCRPAFVTHPKFWNSQHDYHWWGLFYYNYTTLYIAAHKYTHCIERHNFTKPPPGYPTTPWVSLDLEHLPCVTCPTYDLKLCPLILSLIYHYQFDCTQDNALLLLLYLPCDPLSYWPLTLPKLPLISSTNPPKLWFSDQRKSRASLSNHVILVNCNRSVSTHVAYFVLWDSYYLSHLPSMPTTFILGAYLCNFHEYLGPPCPHYMVYLGLGREKHHWSLTQENPPWD